MALTPKYSTVEYNFRDGDDAFTKSPWKYSPASGGISASSKSGFLRLEVDGQSGRNLWCTLKHPSFPIPPGGLLITTRIRCSAASGSEAKFNLPGSLILRFSNNGAVTKYTYWKPGFEELADSSVRPDGKPHVISMIYQPDSTTLYEDGVFKFKWDRANPSVNFDFSSQLLDAGSSFMMDIRNIRVAALGYGTQPSTYVFSVLTDISKDPWSLKCVAGGPSVTACDGYIRYSDASQTQRNQWLFLKSVVPFSTTGGSTINFSVRLNSTNSSEIKLTLSSDLIVRITDGGCTAKYTYSDNGFHELADSAIVKGSGWHSVSIVYLPDRIVLYENMERKFMWVTNVNASEVLKLDWQVLDAGSGSEMDVSNIGINEGLFWKQ